MRRRDFISGVGSVLAGAVGARAQQPGQTRRISLLMTIAESEPEAQARLAAFRAGLQEKGWSEGRNLQIDYRFAAGEPERARLAARDLVKGSPDVVLANGRAILAALKDATATIPIVFVLVPDPVGDGFITSLAKPGGNLTGITNYEFEMGGKWAGLLREIAPNTSRVLLVFNPESAPYATQFLKATKRDVEAILAPVRNDKDIERTFSDIKDKTGTGVIVMPDLFTSGHRATIVTQAAVNRVPTIYPFAFFVTNGGLISYSVDTSDLFKRSAFYVDRILRGENPRDLPVEAPTKFELTINAKTAKTLGLKLPPTLLAQAAKLIE